MIEHVHFLVVVVDFLKPQNRAEALVADIDAGYIDRDFFISLRRQSSLLRPSSDG